MTYFIKTIVTGFILLFSFSNIQSQDAIFTLENVSAGQGSSFCMEVTAANLTDIASMQFSINWDPNLLELQSVENVNPSFASANINTSGSASGISTFSFLNGPVSMTDGEVFFDLCFTVVGTSGTGSANVELTGTPTSIDILSLTNGLIGLQTQGGVVTMPTTLTFSMPDEIYPPTTSFCIPVSVANFNNIESIQCAITWDASVIQYTSVTGFNLPNLNVTSFGTTNASTGVIVFSWDSDSAPGGITVVDGTAIFEMCFTVIGDVNEMTTIDFAGSLNPFVTLEVIQAGVPIGFAFDGGKINIQQILFVTNNELTEPNCDDANSGAINISVAGGTAPYTYLWSNSETTQDINELGVGTYTVTITDSEIPTNTYSIAFSLLGNMTPPIANAGGLDTISCDEPTVILGDASTTSGADIIYEWTHNTGTATIINETTSMPTVNAVGIYTLVVTDTLSGCSATDITIINGGDNIPPLVDAGNTGTLNCGITELQLNGTVSPVGTYTYAWTATMGGNIVNDAMTLTPTIDAAGAYELLVTEMGTGCTASDQVEIALNNNTPSADAGMMMTITCGTSEVTLDGSNSSVGENITYIWSGLGSIVNGNTLTPTVDVTGVFTLLVTDTVSQCFALSMVTVNDDLAAPTAVIAADISGEINCVTTTIDLDGTGSSVGANFEYLWTSIGGNIAGDPATLFPTVDAGGGYILTVTNINNGCTATDTTIVTQDATIPIADAGPDRQLDCEISIVQLNGSNSSLGSQYEYFWTTDIGNIVTDSVTGIAPMVDAAGIYTLQVTDTNTNCTSVSSVTVVIDTIAPVSNPMATSFLSCTQAEVEVEFGTVITSNLSFNWSTPDGNILMSTIDGNIIVNQIGTYCLVLENTENGCKDSTCVEVLENLTPPNADAGQDIVLDCDQSSAFLDGTNSSVGVGIMYEWIALFGNNPTDETSPTPVISSAGEYLLMVTDTINGCTSMDTVLVTHADDYPIAEAGANQIITCDHPTVSLDASLVSSMGSNYSYQWTSVSGSGIVGGANNLLPEIDEAGTYILVVYNDNNNCTAFDSVIVTANNTPVIAQAPATVMFECGDLTVTLDGTGSTTTDVEYLWKTLDGTILLGEDSIIAEVGTAGTYSLCVTNPSSGCADTTIVTVETIPNAPILDVVVSSNLTCFSPEVTLDATGSVIMVNQIFTWITNPNGNGNFVSGQNTLTPVVDGAGVYQFVVTDTILGCDFGAVAIVLVDTSTVTVTGMVDNDITCVIDTVNLEATFTATSTNVVYGWSSMMGGHIISADSNQLMIQADSGGIYQFVAIDTITGCSDTINVEVLDNTDLPIADAGMMMDLPCDVNSIFLDGTGSDTGAEFGYLWTASNGGSILNGETTLTPEINAAGTFTLQVTHNLTGCISTSEVEVITPQAVTATAITPVDLNCGMISIILDGTGSSAGANVTYLWTTTNGTIVGDETTLMVEVSEVGIYTLAVSDSQTSCSASADVEVVFNNTFPNANAGVDFSVCEDTTSLLGVLPADATGLWLSQGAAVPTTPDNPTTGITNLQSGQNIFIWTLSALGCPEYSSDTVIVFFENAAQAADDTYVMEENEILDFNVGANDDFVTGQFEALTSVANGTLTDNGGGDFTYTPNLDFVGTEMFDYELCSDACPDVCDIATVSITVEVKEPLPIDSLINETTNTITPNEDGLNDNFVFEILRQNQEEYPNNEFLVFNRWGDIVYEVKPYNNDWNGTNKKGQPLPEGTYYYILRLDFAAGIVLKGDVTILR